MQVEIITGRIKPFFMRGVCLALLALPLVGCGFSPIYADRAAQDEGGEKQVRTSLNRVAITNIPDRLGQKLRNHLMDRMYARGRPAEPLAHLDVNLTKSEVDLGIQKDATTTRRQLNMWANYTLFDQEGKALCRGKAHSVVSYTKLAAQYGTVAAQENAQDRAVREIGEQITNRLSLYFAESPPEKLTPASSQDEGSFLLNSLPEGSRDPVPPVSASEPEPMLETSLPETAYFPDQKTAP